MSKPCYRRKTEKAKNGVGRTNWICRFHDARLTHGEIDIFGKTQSEVIRKIEMTKREFD